MQAAFVKHDHPVAQLNNQVKIVRRDQLPALEGAPGSKGLSIGYGTVRWKKIYKPRRYFSGAPLSFHFTELA